MTRKIDTLWDHLVELVVSCSDSPARDTLAAHAFVEGGRARAVGLYRRRADGSWVQEACAGAHHELPAIGDVAAHAEAELDAETRAWPSGIEVVPGLRQGERWVAVADAERAERVRDELEALLVLLRVCAGGSEPDHDDDPLEIAEPALPADARHAADTDRERERAIHASRRTIEAVGTRLRSWSEELDPAARAEVSAEIDQACAEAIQRVADLWQRG